MILFLSINEYLRIIKHLKNYFQMKKKSANEDKLKRIWKKIVLLLKANKQKKSKILVNEMNHQYHIVVKGI